MDEYNEQNKGEVGRGGLLYGFFTLRPHSTPCEGVEFIFQNPIRYTAVFSPGGISCFGFCLTFDSTASLLFYYDYFWNLFMVEIFTELSAKPWQWRFNLVKRKKKKNVNSISNQFRISGLLGTWVTPAKLFEATLRRRKRRSPSVVWERAATPVCLRQSRNVRRINSGGNRKVSHSGWKIHFLKFAPKVNFSSRWDVLTTVQAERQAQSIQRRITLN